MENMSNSGFKVRISSMFRSSFDSCRSKNINDVIENPDFLTQNRKHFQLFELFSPKPRPFPSFCGPKYPENSRTEPTYDVVNKNLLPRTKISSDHYTPLLGADFDGRKCPPVSPISFQEFPTKPKEKRNKKPTTRKIRSQNKNREIFDFPGFNYNGLYSSDDDDDDDKTTFFSSKSLSSDSSGSFRKPGGNRRRRGAKKEVMDEGGKNVIPLKGKVKGSFAVVKKSRDPYNDFRTSMVEMIVEKQIFSGKDLENMLQCFLSLNSYHHHRTIVEVFTEIWEALFTN